MPSPIIRSQVRDLKMTGTRSFVLKVLDVGKQFDIAKRGHYDAPSGCVNIWAGPKDKPSIWDIPIPPDAFPEARTYVGALEWEWTDDDTVSFRVEATPYDLLDARRKAGITGRPWKEQQAAVELTEDDWTSILDWLEAKSRELFRLAHLHPDVIGTRCPFCEWVLYRGELLNVLVDHVAADHPEIGVCGLTLGEKVTLDTAKGRYPLVSVEKH